MKVLIAALLALTLSSPAVSAITARPTLKRAPSVYSPLRKKPAKITKAPRPQTSPLVLPANRMPAHAIVPPRPAPTVIHATPIPTLSESARWRFYSYP